MIPVARLNHAVLFVRDAQRSAEFYGRVFGFEIVSTEVGGSAIFMRAAGGANHHDLGLFSVGPEAPAHRAARPASTTWPGRCRASRTWPPPRAPSPRPVPWAGQATTASPSRSTAPIPMATSSRSCGAFHVRRGASTSGGASCCPWISRPSWPAGAERRRRPPRRADGGSRPPAGALPSAFGGQRQVVICSNCGTENRADRKFCLRCGTPLAVGCPNCGAANEPEAGFCGQCGHALAGASGAAASSSPAAFGPSTGLPSPTASGPSPVAERRLVSVLFADLVGFTALAEGRDAEETRELLSRYFELARDVDRPLRRDGREVHRRRGDGRLGRPRRPRGRRRARGAGRPRARGRGARPRRRASRHGPAS